MNNMVNLIPDSNDTESTANNESDICAGGKPHSKIDNYVGEAICPGCGKKCCQAVSHWQKLGRDVAYCMSCGHTWSTVDYNGTFTRKGRGHQH